MGNVIKKLRDRSGGGRRACRITRALQFPFIFQMMFFGYAMFGGLPSSCCWTRRRSRL